MKKIIRELSMDNEYIWEGGGNLTRNVKQMGRIDCEIFLYFENS